MKEPGQGRAEGDAGQARNAERTTAFGGAAPIHKRNGLTLLIVDPEVEGKGNFEAGSGTLYKNTISSY